jgi:transposase
LIRRREEAAKKRRQRALQKQAMLTREITHAVPDAAKQCPKCHGTRFGALGFETSTVYEYVPGHFERRIHRREKAACSCGQHIVTAPAPAKLVAGGQYGFGFAAFLIVEKCADSIPIYRIERRFERLGIPMSRAAMNDLLHAAAELATPLIERLRSRIAALPIVLADETSMRMQQPRKRGFAWVFHGHDDVSDGELVLYIFAADRSGQTPAQLLGGTRGILVVDGYTGYNNVTDTEGRARAGCWCHLRRKLFEARTAAGDDADIGIASSGSSSTTGAATERCELLASTMLITSSDSRKIRAWPPPSWRAWTLAWRRERTSSSTRTPTISTTRPTSPISSARFWRAEPIW